MQTVRNMEKRKMTTMTTTNNSNKQQQQQILYLQNWPNLPELLPIGLGQQKAFTIRDLSGGQ